MANARITVTKPKDTQVIAVNGKFYHEQPDGSLLPVKDKTDWKKVRMMSEKQIEAAAKADEDNPLIDDSWLASVKKEKKTYIHIGLDNSILTWFKGQTDHGYQTIINNVLKQYMNAHKK